MKIIFVLIMILCAGCGTVQNRAVNDLCVSRGGYQNTVFPAMQQDVEKIQYRHTNYIVDIPFSIVTDLVLLPYDLTVCSFLRR